jgi:hypothetical protein
VDLEWLRQRVRAETLQSLLSDYASGGSSLGAIPFSQAEIFFEQNATDGDLGIHFALDGPPWESVMIFFPNGDPFISVTASGAERENGVTGLFSESAEPGFEVVPPDEFLSWFPEGAYLMVGVTTDGGMLVSEATLTHDLPEEPEAISPREEAVVEADEPLTIRWRRTPDPAPPESVIVGYQVIVTEIAEPPEREREFIIDLLPTQRRVEVPAEFFRPGREYKYEILARETSGNQTITEVEFSTEEDD